jgi:hypothetical protein
MSAEYSGPAARVALAFALAGEASSTDGEEIDDGVDMAIEGGGAGQPFGLHSGATVAWLRP